MDNGKLEIIKREFSECFDRDGNFNIEKFQEIISPEAKLFKDSYGLNWLGKSYARALAQVDARTMIREDVEHNKKEKNKDSENIYIKGDNLEVLRHLNNGYREKIKMIYIDPPYNTKSGEFVYNDNRDFSKKELEKLVEAKVIEEDEKERILKWEGSSSSHSAWLTFMFPRLYLARKLLTEDGVIFISIDDNEVAQLKLMCDEIFGEENFIAKLAVQLNPRGRNLDKYVAKTNEYILIYAKDEGTNKTMSGIEKSGDMIKEYNKKDQYGKYRLTGLRNRNQAFNPQTRPNLYYPLYINPKNYTVSSENNEEFTEITYPITSEDVKTCWTWGKDKVTKESDLLVAEKLGEEWRIYRKDYLCGENGEIATTLIKSVWIDKEINNDYGKKSIKNLFEKNVMSFPKSPYLIEKLTKVGGDKDGIVLDFFSGSATTAHAVNRLNTEDGGHRKWIMIQLEEEVNPKNSKEAYNFCIDNDLPTNITSIGIERVKRANTYMLNKLENKKEEGFNRKELENKLGFKIFKIDNKIKELEEMKEFTREIKLHEPISFIHNDKLDLVHTYKLQDGNFLNTKIEKIKFSWEKKVVGGDGTGSYIYVAYKVGEILYLIDSINSNEILKGIIEKIDNDPEFKINKLVVYGFTNTNGKYRADLLENIQNYNNKKGADIEVEVRY